MYGVTARLCRYWHSHSQSHTHAQRTLTRSLRQGDRQTDREAGTPTRTHTHTRTQKRAESMTFDARTASFYFFALCVKIADSDSRCICNPHLSVGMAWHGMVFRSRCLTTRTHTHTHPPFTLYISTVSRYSLCILGWMMTRTAWCSVPYVAHCLLAHTMHTLHHVGQFYSYFFLYIHLWIRIYLLPSLTSSSSASSFMLVLKPLNYWYVCVWTACSGARARYQIDLSNSRSLELALRILSHSATASSLRLEDVVAGPKHGESEREITAKKEHAFA